MNYDQLLEKLKQDLPLDSGLIPHNLKSLIWLLLCLLLFLVIVGYGLAALSRHYRVWSARKEGEADMVLADLEGKAALLRAHSEQQIQAARAKGRLDAAELNKQAEIIDAQAVAKSVEIIGKTLHENEGYLRWKWIEMMDSTDNATIYVPTEANLPILEAGNRPVKSGLVAPSQPEDHEED